MTSKQIEQSAFNDFMNFNWESTERITSASPNAQFLFESYLYYFYIPATGVFFSVERDGNYYHGYETIIKKCSKEDVLQIARINLARSQQSFPDSQCIAHWEGICSKLQNLP